MIPQPQEGVGKFWKKGRKMLRIIEKKMKGDLVDRQYSFNFGPYN